MADLANAWPSQPQLQVGRTLAIEVSCPQCARPIDYRNATTNGLLAVTIMACEPCNREWELTVRIVPHDDPVKAAKREQKRRLRTSPAPRG